MGRARGAPGEEARAARGARAPAVAAARERRAANSGAARPATSQVTAGSRGTRLPLEKMSCSGLMHRPRHLLRRHRSSPDLITHGNYELIPFPTANNAKKSLK